MTKDMKCAEGGRDFKKSRSQQKHDMDFRTFMRSQKKEKAAALLDWTQDHTMSEVSNASTNASVIHSKPGCLGFYSPS